jgi:hypothetical protein
MTPCRRTALSRCAVLALALSACGETTAPRPTLGITVSVAELRGPTVSANGDGQPTVTCEIDLRAAAAGKGTATWLDATFRIYIGKNRSTPIDSAMVSAEEIAQVWGAPEIAAGERQESRWIATVGIPFSATMEFRYRPSSGSRVHSATVSFSCSPEIPPNAAPPQISTLTVTPPSGELPAGAPLTVSYAATAQTGLWMTGLRISGHARWLDRRREQLRRGDEDQFDGSEVN